MITATISQTKNQLSSLLDRVRNGERVLIVDRDTPIARIEPVVQAGSEGRLARLVRAGLVQPGSGKLAPELVDEPPVRACRGGDVLAALVAEREDSR